MKKLTILTLIILSYFSMACFTVNTATPGNVVIPTNETCIFIDSLNTTLNVTQQLNENFTLQNGQCYINQNNNITVCTTAPINYTGLANFSKTLNLGENYLNATVNVSFFSSTINQTVQLEYSECQGINDSVTRGYCEQIPANAQKQSYTNNALGLIVKAPSYPQVFNVTNIINKQYNTYQKISNNEAFYNNETNETALCLAPNTPLTAIGRIQSKNDTDKCTGSSIFNLAYDNNDFNKTIPVCLSDIKSMCTSDEILSGSLSSCIARYNTNLIYDLNSTRASDQKCQIELQLWKQGDELKQSGREDTNQFYQNIMLIIAVIVLAIIVALVILRKSKSSLSVPDASKSQKRIISIDENEAKRVVDALKHKEDSEKKEGVN